MKKSQQRVLLFILLVLIPAFLHPESPASVLATSQTPDQKWEKALEFYKKKEYQHALPILRELEEKWGAADHRERFRQDFMGRIASFSLSVPGTAPPYRALFADEFERLRAAYFEENSA